MATEKYSLDIDAPASKVWAALSDFSNIQLFHPNVKYTDQLSEMDRGLGASRRCNFYTGGSAVESITAWDDDRRTFTCTVTEIATSVQTGGVATGGSALANTGFWLWHSVGGPPLKYRVPQMDGRLSCGCERKGDGTADAAEQCTGKVPTLGS